MALPTRPTRPRATVEQYIQLYYGPPGVGKTTFVDALAPGHVLFISTDRGTRHLETMRVEAFDWKSCEAVLRELAAPGAPKYKLICIDHVDDWASMAEAHVCKTLGVDGLGDAGFGKGWKAYRNALEGYTRQLMRLGSGVVFIAHEDSRKVKISGVERDRINPAMSKSAWKVLIPMADVVGYCGITLQKGKGENAGPKMIEVRTVRTQPTETIYAKDRTIRRRPSTGLELLDGSRFIATFYDHAASAAAEDGEIDHGSTQYQPTARQDTAGSAAPHRANQPGPRRQPAPHQPQHGSRRAADGKQAAAAGGHQAHAQHRNGGATAGRTAPGRRTGRRADPIPF